MAELTPKTISELPAVAYINLDDLFAISSDGASKKVSMETFRKTLGVAFISVYPTLVAGETLLEKFQKAVNDPNSKIPQDGTPFVGKMISGSTSFIEGILYDSDGLYGFVLIGTYSRVEIYCIRAGNYIQVFPA